MSVDNPTEYLAMRHAFKNRRTSASILNHEGLERSVTYGPQSIANIAMGTALGDGYPTWRSNHRKTQGLATWLAHR